jgi:putative nucleotidyltransferase with HDIG domain
MTHESTVQPDTHALGLPTASPADEARIEHLFRGARRSGRIHPLQHLVQRHRAAHPGRDLATATGPGATPAAAAPLDRLDRTRVLQQVRELPPLPKAALDALAALRDERSSNAHCGELMARDQALVARTLRLANSAFYGVPGRVGSMRDAVNLLGRRTLGSVATVATLSQQFAPHACPGFSFAGFWRHAIAVALTSQALAKTLHADDETAFTAGLLHDLGRLALATHFPQHMAHAIQALKETDQQHVDVEQALLGADHVSVGALVATQWHFPAEVTDAIAGHHGPTARPDAAASLADTVHVADAIAHALDLAGDADDMVPALDVGAWQRMNLSTAAVLAIFSSTTVGVAQLCEDLDLQSDLH